jgi:hypothetical protein
MSYLSLKANNYYITIHRGANFNSSTNYAVITGATITNGFPYDTSVNSSNMTYSSIDRFIPITVRGLYIVSCGFNIANNDNTNGDDTIAVGFTISNSADSIHTYYHQSSNAEYHADGFKVSNSIVQIIELQVGDKIRGTVTGCATTINFIGTASAHIVDSRACNYISVALIAPFSG